MTDQEILKSAPRLRRTGSPGTGYRSPWYTGHECPHTPDSRAYQQWRQTRSDWVETQRPEDFERMLASVTPDNPPLASEIQRKHGNCPREPMPAAQDRIRQAAALTMAAITAMTVAVILVLGVALALIAAVLQGGRTWRPESGNGSRHDST